jgi:hypothetical protein
VDLHEFPYRMDDTRSGHLQHYQDATRKWIAQNLATLEHIAGRLTVE